MFPGLGPSWGDLGAVLAWSWAILGYLGTVVAILRVPWSGLRPLLEYLTAILKPPGWSSDHLTACWGDLGSSWARLGPSYGVLGAMLGRLGPSWRILRRLRGDLGAA